MPPRRLSLAQARRAALAAQGFADPRPQPGTATRAHLLRVVSRVAAVQVDSVNVLARSQYLPLLSRLGPYDVELLDALRDGPRRALVEYWAHEASLVELETWPLLSFRMRRAMDDAWGGMRGVAAERPDLVAAVLHTVRTEGPLTSREVEVALAHEAPARTKQWGWNWSLVKHALEHLFWTGQVTAAGRNRQFERRYAVSEAILPREVVARGPHGETPVSDATCAEALMLRAARSLGVATEPQLRDYFRLRPPQSQPALASLVERGELEEVEVEGWRAPSYSLPGLRIPRAVPASALLSPFDSLIWHRPRTAALFGMDFRLEIYVPAEKRVYGYYVLPFLHDERLVARVDLKADRSGGVLRVQGLHLEPGAGAEGRAALDDELHLMAAWLRLSDVVLA